jgi:formate-dependent nitrite reductase membrane component NrfD
MSVRLDEFLIDVKPQREWGWAVITYLFLGGAGAGLFLVSLYMRHTWGEGLGLLVLVLGALFLLIDLGRPERFWRAFFRPQTSWISRGCLFITALVILGALEIISAQTPLAEGASRVMITGAAAIAAITVMVYTGFVLSPSPAIPFWNSAFFPVIFFAYSLLAGIDFLILASPVLPGSDIDIALLEKFQFGLVLVCLLMVLSHLSVMSGSAVAARKSIELLTKGKWRILFIGGVIGLGLVIPLLFAWPVLWTSGFQAMFAVTAVLALLRLFGDYLFRFLVIRAGHYDPLL